MRVRPAVTLLLGAVIGWFFGEFIATLFVVTEKRRGEEAAEKLLRRLEREVTREERLAAAAR